MSNQVFANQNQEYPSSVVNCRVPYCEVIATAPQIVPSGPFSNRVVFDTVIADTANMFDINTSNFQITIPSDGIYSIVGYFCFSSDPTGLNRNGSIAVTPISTGILREVIVDGKINQNFTATLNPSGILKLSKGDIVGMDAFNATGTDSTIIISAAGCETRLSVACLGNV